MTPSPQNFHNDAAYAASGGEVSVLPGSAQQSMAVTQLTLTDFRSYDFQRLESDRRSVILTGPNGAGKTNLLEALSFLVPGRGLRRAKVQDMSRRSPGEPEDTRRPWGVAALVQTPEGETELGTGRDPGIPGANRERRIVKVNGETVSSQSVLSEHLSMVWLTPQMDRLFIDGASARRRFLDRLVYGFDPAHSGRVSAWEKAARSRLKLLKEGRLDDHWLKALETTMAEKAIAIAAARQQMAEHLNAACQDAEGPFPKAGIEMTGRMEEMLKNKPALAVEEDLRAALVTTRLRDGETGATSEGPQKSDLKVIHLSKKVGAEQCSTGEQKALLIAIVLADARLRMAERGAPPILLLDEIAAHLDGQRREALFDEIFNLGAQAWVTGTDQAVFASLGDKAQFFGVEDGAIRPQ